jgi:polysaccharide deacetylase 2 family uncharacterized protein YibQ
MKNKRKKEVRGKGRSIPFLLLILLAAVLTGVALVSLFHYLSNGPRGIPQPVYEEIYSSADDLHDYIRGIDDAIYESLYLSGIRERDISFSNVQPRHQNGHVWDFVEVTVKCPDLQSAVDTHETLIHKLSALGPEIRLRNEKTPDKRDVCHIFAKDFYTHKIIIGFDGHRVSAEEGKPKVAIIIDDLGHDFGIGLSFIHLDLPLSFSVLPRAPFTEAIVKAANEKGCEVILHLPMEPKNYPSVDPGPGALFLTMDECEIIQILDQDLSEIPGVRGVNNHMGSSFTENQHKMLTVLEELKKRDLFYVDSRTTSRSVGSKLARKIGLPVAKRNVFLDHDINPRAIKIQMERLLSIAEHSGSAIGIGHPHKETLNILMEYSSRLKRDFNIVLVSELVS